MSISPIDAQRPVSNRTFGDPEQNPSSGHGLIPLQHDFGPLRSQINGSSSSPFGSAQSSADEPPGGSPAKLCGTSGSCKNTSDVPRNVNSRCSNASKHLSGQQSGTYPHYQLSGQRGSSHFKSNKLEPQPNGTQAACGNVPCYDCWPLDSNDIHITAQVAPSRRREVVNANHLLNFHYDTISRSRPQQRLPPPRRQERVKPYNKDLFLQANYKFVIYDSGCYSVESIDPDKMFPWEDVVCVRYSSAIPVHCPICLESPLCPQITSCGHIYCFPCILRYLLMGVEEHKGESWKKCPLCFSMVSSKDLYTIMIDDVKQFCVGDHADFALLARAKDSLVPSLKRQYRADLIPGSFEKIDLFSKFILTSDIELSVRDAKMGLTDWLCKAEKCMVDDLEKLPYICAALEQLEERMKKWVENHNLYGRTQPSHFTVPSGPKVTYNPNSSNPSSFNSNLYTECAQSDALMVSNTLIVGCPKSGQVHKKLEFSMNSNARSDFLELMYDKEKALQKDSSSSKNFRERDSYSFYQAIDGQPLILHPLSMKCLLHHYGSYDMLPARISGVILELETITQSEAMRKRYRYLSHFSLTTTFQLCEIELAEMLPPTSLAPFMDEIKKREKQRKQLVKKELEEKARTDAAHCAEVATLREMLNPTNQRYLSDKDTIFSLDEFEALGSAAAPSTSPSVNCGRKLFSNITRLGYAAAHDSPALRVDESADSALCMDANATQEASGSQGTGIAAMPSFANILSSAKEKASAGMPNSNAISRKGKKSNRVLLSTSGGRRY